MRLAMNLAGAAIVLVVVFGVPALGAIVHGGSEAASPRRDFG